MKKRRKREMSKKDYLSADKRARQLRDIIRHFHTRSPVERAVELTVGKENTIRIPSRITQDHLGVGEYDTVCVFLIQDGSILIMEKGMAEERLGREYEYMLQTNTKN